MRIIYLGGKVVQTYIRQAKKDDFRCNEHQGGTLIYTKFSEIPLSVRKFSEKVAKLLGNQQGLFALDFIISNTNTIYFVEGNSGPGIDWNLSLAENEKKAKILIRGIVRELAKRVNSEATRMNFMRNQYDQLPI